MISLNWVFDIIWTASIDLSVRGIYCFQMKLLKTICLIYLSDKASLILSLIKSDGDQHTYLMDVTVIQSIELLVHLVHLVKTILHCLLRERLLSLLKVFLNVTP